MAESIPSLSIDEIDSAAVTDEKSVNSEGEHMNVDRSKPNSDPFDTTNWFAKYNAGRQHGSDYVFKPMGVSFMDLSVHGYNSINDYQLTFASSVLAIWSYVQNLFRSSRQEVEIISNFLGFVDSGEMLLVLGRPGSGCSTLLKSLSGNTHGLSVDSKSKINFRGISPQLMHSEFCGECIYSAELDVHFPELTVEETLGFAAKARARCYERSRSLGDSLPLPDALIAMFRLKDASNTKVGNEFIRGISGGERKRLSIAEALSGWSPLQFWDNSTRGLDSATALRLVQIIRLFTRVTGSAATMSLYQVSEPVLALFDKVTVLFGGRQIYFGPVKSAKKYFEDLGFDCPAKATTADFLTALTHPIEARQLIRTHCSGRVPRTPEDFASIWQNSPECRALFDQVNDFNQNYPVNSDLLEQMRAVRRVEKDKSLRQSSPFTISIPTQIKLTLGRAFRRLANNLAPPISGGVGNVIMGMIVGSIFYNLADNTGSFYSRGVLVYFSIILNAFMSAFEVLTIWVQRPIAEKHNRLAFYHPFTEASSAMICDLPNKLLTSIFFNLVLYFLSNLRRTPEAFFTFWLFSFVCLLTMSMFFRMVGSLSRTLIASMAPVASFLMLYIIYTGFVLPQRYMHPWLRWIGYINPVAYAFESLMINEFSGRHFSCSDTVPRGPVYANVSRAHTICSAVGAVSGLPYVDGETYIRKTFSFESSHLWRNLGILFAMMIFFFSIHLTAAEYVLARKSKGEVLLFRRGKFRPVKNATDEESFLPHTDDHGSSETKNSEILPSNLLKQNVVFQWENVSYDVKIPKGSRRLLHEVDGWVKPGTLTALMGVTGAGKTTLLDVLASRATLGVVSGEILVNGHPRDNGFQRKTGYAQQLDFHLPTTTVREALRLSAILRQPHLTPTKTKIAYVEEVIDVLEMKSYADAVVGVPGEGLNVEQRKRLTIAVEMAAKPELLLFLDEPTSGLDSQTAWSVCTLLQKLAKHGQAILCTIHQPSALLFEKFDQLLLLGPGGRTVYFGDIGGEATTLIHYLESNGARHCHSHENVAEWMLEVTSIPPETEKAADWPDVWQESPERKAVKEKLASMKDELSVEPIQSNSTSLQEFAAPFYIQLLVVTKRTFAHYWREPSYLWSKFALCFAEAFFIGFSFWESPNSLQGLQNQLFAVFLVMTIYSNLIQQIMPEFEKHRDLYAARERPSKIYSWKVFITSLITFEFAWQTLMSVIIFATWYYPIGMSRDTGSSASERSALILLFIWEFLVFTSTFAHLLIAGIALAETAVNLGQLFYYLCLIFSGVLVSPTALPGFWKFMYRISPITYLISGMMSTAVAGKEITCSPTEILKFSPPPSQTCGRYMSQYLQYAGGKVLDPDSTSVCQFCPLRDTNSFLETIGIAYHDRWRNFGLLLAYIAFNIVGTFIIFWLAWVPKKRK